MGTRRADASRIISFSQKTIEALPVPKSGEEIYWDESRSGFGVRVSWTGLRTFFYYGRSPGDGRQFKLRIGRYDREAFPVAKARVKAIELAGQIAGEKDPSAERQAKRQSERARRAAPTMRDLAEEYLSDYRTKWGEQKRPACQRDDRGMLGLPEEGRKLRSPITVLSELGNKKVSEVTQGDVKALFAKVGRSKKANGERKLVRANRMLMLLSTVFNFAITCGYRNDNPATGIAKNPETPREVEPDDAVATRLVKALSKSKDPSRANIIKLLLLTGARKGEVLNATWAEFDLKQGNWKKPSAHTKQKREHTVQLSAPAIELLVVIHAERQRRAGSRAIVPKTELVFPGKDGKTPIQNLKRFWAGVVKDADLGNFRIHDIRHLYASMLASEGVPLYTIGKLLGHTQSKTTERYSAIKVTVQRDATEKFGAKFLEFSNAPDKVVPIQAGKS